MFAAGNTAEHFQEGRRQLAGWYKTGKLQHKETVTEGFENIPSAFTGLFSGENIGKQIVKMEDY